MQNTPLRMVTIGVSTLDEVKARVAAAFRGEPQGSHICFATPERFSDVMTAKRWELLRVLMGQDPMSIRAAARLVSRDVKAVHGDVQALLHSGVLQKTDDGLIVFPYDAVEVKFAINPSDADQAAA